MPVENEGETMTKDQELVWVFEEIVSIFGHYFSLEPARICLVLDPPLNEDYELAVAILPKLTEERYRERIREEADYQLLWNPAEFPIYGERSIRVRGTSPDNEGSLGTTKHMRTPEEIKEIAMEACSVANEKLDESGCFAFVVDPELSHLAKNLDRLRGIPENLLSERPSWLK
jgi:hypothetical protein